MRRGGLIMYCLAAMFLAGSDVSAQDSGKDSSNLLKGVTLMKQSTVRIAAERTVYFDPYSVSGKPSDADIVFITHTHSDHPAVLESKKSLP